MNRPRLLLLLIVLLGVADLVGLLALQDAWKDRQARAAPAGRAASRAELPSQKPGG